ncbi:hypothetical protein C8J56DRAFT_717299, partial [Mycena floridula]
LEALIEVGGAGMWPPVASGHLTWPVALRPYHQAYQEISTNLPVLASSLDDDENRQRIHDMRSKIQHFLRDYLDTSEVQQALEALFSESTREVQAVWMGFCACIAHLRHAYRWGISPVVRVAQTEAVVSFPEALELPWSFIQRRFGLTSPGGGLTSNIYFNTIQNGIVLYSITASLPEEHRKTEFWNTSLFLEMERSALPMYRAICSAAIALDRGNISESIKFFHTVNEILKTVFRFFYDNLHDSNVSHQLWMAYVQGFHGWALEGIDGVSGG